MAVTACEFRDEKVSYTLTKTTITAEYLVSTDAYAKPSAIKDLAHADKPDGQSTHDTVTNAFVTGIDCSYLQGTSDPYQYVYTVTFETPDALTPGPVNANPEDDEPEIDWGGADREEVVNFDQDGVPIVNAALQFFEPPYSREEGDAAVVITRNENTNNAALWNSYSHSTNSDPWHGDITAFRGKFGRITARKQWRNGVPYWRVSYPIVFKEKGWKPEPLNVGTVELHPDGKRKEQNDLAQYTTTPRPLTLPSGGDPGGKFIDPIPANPAAWPKLPKVKLYKERAWAALNLPNPFA